MKMPVSEAFHHAIVSAENVDRQTLSYAPLFQSITLPWTGRPRSTQASASTCKPTSWEAAVQFVSMAYASFRATGPSLMRRVHPPLELVVRVVLSVTGEQLPSPRRGIAQQHRVLMVHGNKPYNKPYKEPYNKPIEGVALVAVVHGPLRELAREANIPPPTDLSVSVGSVTLPPVGPGQLHGAFLQLLHGVRGHLAHSSVCRVISRWTLPVLLHQRPELRRSPARVEP